MGSHKDMPVLMNFVKQKKYREMKNKSFASESVVQKSLGKLKDKLRYIQNEKLPKLAAKINETKTDKKKTKSKANKRVLKLKLENLLIDVLLVKIEEAELIKKLAFKK